MKRVYALVAAATLISLIAAEPTRAAPPTVTPSPGYDARLQEQRAAGSAVRGPVTPASPRTSRHHLRRRHHHRAR
ncbi:MAG TPA: hypothetical protein VHB49_08540 [Bradyrhizobium sp.]|nr:hypothetical protein [Bradyrhizobium sp.]